MWEPMISNWYLISQVHREHSFVNLLIWCYMNQYCTCVSIISFLFWECRFLGSSPNTQIRATTNSNYFMYMYYRYINSLYMYNIFEENWFFNMLNFLVRITLQINQKNEQPQILMILPIIFIACKIFGRKWLFNMLAQIWFNESISKCTYLSTYIHYIRQGTSFSFPKTDIIVKCTLILNNT